MPTNRDIYKDFTAAMIEIYRRSLKETGVNHAYFLRMITETSGHEAAIRLIHAEMPSEGYTDLQQKGRLDLTAEALVLQPRWNAIFENETRHRARERLRAFEFDFARFGLSET